MRNLRDKIWWDYLEVDLQGLLTQSHLLIEKVGDWEEKFHDYSFMVFPAAKAYEGFLKKLFLDLQFISTDDYYGKRFRIGKALNPSLESHMRSSESVYDKVVGYCGGQKLADKMWETWKDCRNALFHWFPEEKRSISYQEARDKVGNIIATIDECFKECKLDQKPKNDGKYVVDLTNG